MDNSKILLLGIIYCISLFLIQCKSNSETSTQEKIDDSTIAFKAEKFRSDIGEKSDLFNQLNEYLVDHLDTIMNFKKTMHSSTNLQGERKTSYHKRINLLLLKNTFEELIPLENSVEIKKIWSSLGFDYLQSIKIDIAQNNKGAPSKLPQISYGLARPHNSNRAIIYRVKHRIHFNNDLVLRQKIDNSKTSMIKDSLIASLHNLKYYIIVEPYTGW